MADQDDEKKKEKMINFIDDSTKQVKQIPANPGFLDYVKEGFETNDTRAQINAIRRRREKYGA